MGFRTGAYATVWEVTPKSDTVTRARISINRKSKQTGEYETDFSGFVEFVGSGTANKAASLERMDRIKLGDVDVSTYYKKETGVSYTNFKCFTFENVEKSGNSGYSDAQYSGGQEPYDDDASTASLPF